MNTNESVMIEINEEDIMNLKNAEDRIFNSVISSDEHYEALEIFTIQDIISRYYKAVNNEIHKYYDDLTHVCDLIYYDGPLLSLYKHKINNKLYIYYWYDVFEDYNTFIIFETNKDLLLQFITNKISLKYLIINHIDTAYFVDIYYTKNDIDIYKYRKIDNINKVKDLPGDDSYYDIDAESIWTSNIGEILQNNIFNFS